jgi:type II secretory pathway component GspD/PulD (secretin)
VVPDDGALTVVSDDPEALEQFERLLRSLYGGGGEIGRNISIFEVQHSDAVEIAEKLDALFNPTSRTGSTWRRGTGALMIVPDERQNTIMVQGSRIDRETIQGLIRALDTDRGQADKPRLVPLRNVDAEEVAQVVGEVFRSKLSRSSSSVSRSSSRSTTSTSRQLSSVAVDEATNSLIVMAPVPLVDEIIELAQTLDDQAAANPAQRVRIIQLQRASSSRVQEALDRILDSRSTSRSR